MRLKRLKRVGIGLYSAETVPHAPAIAVSNAVGKAWPSSARISTAAAKGRQGTKAKKGLNGNRDFCQKKGAGLRRQSGRRTKGLKQDQIPNENLQHSSTSSNSGESGRSCRGQRMVNPDQQLGRKRNFQLY